MWKQSLLEYISWSLVATTISCPHSKSRIVAAPLYPLIKPKFYEQTAGNAEMHDLFSNVNKKVFFISIILASFTSDESYFNTANLILFMSFHFLSSSVLYFIRFVTLKITSLITSLAFILDI